MNRIEAAKIARSHRNIPPLHIRFWSKVEVSGIKDCWNWTACVRNKKEGYGAFWYKGKHHPAPRIALYLVTGNLETTLQICHKCDNPSCCNPYHLFKGTHQENNADKIKKNRDAKGDSHAHTKLKAFEVVEIRALNGSISRKNLAKKYSVTIHVINDLLCGRTWKHL